MNLKDDFSLFIGARRAKKPTRQFSQSRFRALPVALAASLFTWFTGWTTQTNAQTTPPLPSRVDNSKLPSFPPIESQGPTGACSVFAALYTQMTHMAGLANQYNNKTSRSTVFAPNWGMNFGVGGPGSYSLSRKNGVASWEDIPFTPSASVWNTDPAVWARALVHRVDKNGSIGNIDKPEAFQYMKELLSQGYVLYFDTWIGSFMLKRSGSHPSVNLDPEYIGKNVIWGMNGYVAGHSLAIVGYNDDVWVDINNNGQVDTGEMGVIKVANSWGEAYEDRGFSYVAYDALRENSQVVGVPTNRRYGSIFNYNTAYWVTFKKDYYPRLLAEVTLNTRRRNQLKVQLGYSSITENTPQHTWSSYMLNGQGGASGFNGTDNATDGGFTFDFTDLITDHNLEGSGLGRWYVIISDTQADGNPVLLKNFTLIDNITKQRIQSPNTFPVSVDGSVGRASVDYSLQLPADNQAPTVPSNLLVASGFANRATLSWGGSADNVAIKHYRVFRNGNFLLNTEMTSISETNLPLGQSYEYTVAAVDTSNNISAVSNAVTVVVPNSATFDTSVPYVLRNKKSNRALSAAQGTYALGVPVVQYNYTRQGSQHWNLRETVDDSFWIYTLPGQTLAQVENGSIHTGARVTQWSNTGSDGCKWIFLLQPTGEYVITNKRSGHVLSPIGGSTEHGAGMEQTAFVNDASQLWIIEEVSPLAISQSVTVMQDTSVPITLTGRNKNNNPMTFAVLTQPTKGDLSGTPPALTYTPDPGFTGTDKFTFRVNDGTTNSATATVTITVTPKPVRRFYISPDGDDGNDGSSQSTFATIQHTRDVIRSVIAGGMTEDIVVQLGAGNYFIEQPVVFDDRDSGNNGFTVTYQGAPNLGTRIYGGRRITGWTQLNDTEYVANVPEVQQHYTLYENDQAANGGIFHGFSGVTVGNWRKSNTQLIYHPRNLPITNQVIVLGTTKDVFVVMGRSIQQPVSNLVFDGLHMIGSDFTSSWKAGVTGFDGWTGTYDGVPLNNQPLGVIFPEARHGQFFLQNAENIVIRNSKLYGAGFMAVFFNRWAQNNRVENCWIENAGASGLYFQGWESGRGATDGITTLEAAYCNKFNVVRNNVFHDIGRFAWDAAGVYLCWSGDNLVEHNVFHGITRYGVSLKGWRPRMINNLFYWVFHNDELPPGADGQNYAYDQQHITYYDGYVVTNANQGAEVNHSRNNIIRYNDLSQIARTGDDMGMIEMWGAGTGNVWEYNSCHDAVNTAGWDNNWMHILFNDDGGHGTTLRGNIMYWIAGGGMSRAIMSKGNNQTNLYNILADSDLSSSATVGPFVEQAHNMVWSNNIIAAKMGQITVGPFGGTETVGGVTYPIVQQAQKNVYFYQPIDPNEPSGSGAQTIQNQVNGRRQGGGLDSDLVYADPLFVRQNPWWDSQHSDYRLQPSSPALAMGYQETDMSMIGLRDDYPFDAIKILGQSVGKIRLAADYSRLFKIRIHGSRIEARNSGPLPVNSWVRYNNMDFESGQYEQFQVRMERASSSQNNGPTIEIRLNAPDGELIGTVPSGLSTCRIKQTTGLHDIFLVFPNGNVQNVDWFIFEPRTVWTGDGADNQWSNAANWSSKITNRAPLYFGSSDRLSPNNNLSIGTSVAGIGFDFDAPSYNLGGNSIALTGDIINNSTNHQTIQLPLILSSLGALRVDAGVSGITLSGDVSGSPTGSCDQFIKGGSAPLTLLGNFNFTGDVTIESGTLSLSHASLSDTANIRIDTSQGGAIDLPHGLTDRVGKLYINGIRVAEGTYGSTSSEASYRDDTTFSGTGMLLVQSGPLPPVLTTRADGRTVATFAGAGTGNWTVPPGVTEVELLVVGGGGGGSALSGGGGAGGLYYNADFPVIPGNQLPIVIGAGGAAGSGTGNGSDGAPSKFGDQLIAYGGIRGMNTNSANGGNQGGYSLDGGQTIIAGKSPSEPRASGWWSGSGAGAAGSLGVSAAGGAGLQFNISGSNLYYAGGGGAHAYGLGGSAIGGNGASALNRGDASAGAPNTGSGGGGGRNATSPNSGGSGIIVLAYQQQPTTPTTTVLASSANPSTNGQSITFTATVKTNGLTATDATGNFIFAINGLTVATSPIVNGSATYTNNNLGPGPHHIKASYFGDAQYDVSWTNLTQVNNSPYVAATPVYTTRDDGYTIATFSNTDLSYWTVPEGISKVQVLAVGGGGSGASGSTWNADGGGAGGLAYIGSYNVTPGRLLPVLVGTGGAARTTYSNGTNGAASSFDLLTAAGGEGGLTNRGGNSGGLNIDGVITSGGLGATHSGSNGGGGAGQNGTGAHGPCPGGNGYQIGITGTLTYYAGGGGGGYQGAGGLGGGGRGNYLNGGSGPGENGVNGLGGGGGASRENPTSGAGGSGIIILAYPDASVIWTVNFESNGGQPVSSQTVADSSTVTPPTAPIRFGYTFRGWYSDAALTTPFSFSTPILANTTLYAKWLTHRTVTFESNGGSAVASQTVLSGNTAMQPNPPTKAGYLFDGWYSDSELTNLFSFTTAITADTTLHAKWKASYTLNYSASAGGSISGTTVQIIAVGGNGSEVTAVPDSAYRFVMWSDESTSNPRTDVNVTNNITVTAIFELLPVWIEPTRVTTRSDGKTVATFTAGSGEWIVPNGVTNVEVLIVGGGGSGAAGGTWNADGGGGGGITYFANYSVTGGSVVPITVGDGGAARSSYGPGNRGNSSEFSLLTASGGEGGLNARGGNSGGLNLNGVITSGGLGATHGGSNGGGGAGQNGAGNFGACPGGNGYQIAITGISTYYAGGGGGGYQGAGGLGGGGRGNLGGAGPGEAGVNGLGGGGGASRDNIKSGAGGAGVVIVAYHDSSNTPPVANAQSVTTLQNTPKAIILTGNDADTDPLTFEIVMQPANGTLSGTAPNVTYTPLPGYTGEDDFTFVVNDGTVDSVTAVVTITVTPANNAPVANPQSVSVVENLAQSIVLTGSDQDSNPLTYAIVTQPAHGSLTGTPPNVTYTPANGYTGADSFTFKTNDGIADSEPAVISITVTESGMITPIYSTRADGYTVATFTAGSGNWIIPARVTAVEVLVVGGGGSGAAGGTWNADGGGGGGLTYSSSYSVTSGSAVPITVGDGGAARSSNGAGNAGNASSFDLLTAQGGNGGLNSRGGNSGGLNLNGVITSGGLGATHGGSNGGGGAGQNGAGNFGACPGGNGYQIAITGTNTYYAGGGGGGYQGAGGLGGGGRGNYLGSNAGPGQNGVDGLGGGGGASRDNPNSGAGGDGVVIIAYLPVPNAAPVANAQSMPPAIEPNNNEAPITAYQQWGEKYQDPNLTDPNGDVNGDGVSNFHEFAFGLNPTNANASNPIVKGIDKNTRTFRYTRLDSSGLNYTVWTSTDLVQWHGPVAVVENVSLPDNNGVVTVDATLDAIPDSGSLFIRVKAD